MQRLTKIINRYTHGAEGVSINNLTGNYCRGEFEATAIVERLAEYEAIGTLEECREAVEKQKAMKPYDMEYDENEILHGYCPNCNRFEISVDIFCCNCGQKLDWGSEGEE